MAPRPALSSRQGTEYYDTLLVVHTADEPAAPSSSAVGEKRKRKCSQTEGEEEEAEAEQGGEQMLASAFVLTQCSPYFSAALAEQWGGDRKRVEVAVDSLPAFQHLLEFMHSMGKALPAGALPARGQRQPDSQPDRQPARCCAHDASRASLCEIEFGQLWGQAKMPFVPVDVSSSARYLCCRCPRNGAAAVHGARFWCGRLHGSGSQQPGHQGEGWRVPVRRQASPLLGQAWRLIRISPLALFEAKPRLHT